MPSYHSARTVSNPYNATRTNFIPLQVYLQQTYAIHHLLALLLQELNIQMGSSACDGIGALVEIDQRSF